MKNSLSRVERINFLTKNKRYVAPIAFQLKLSARKLLSAGAFKTWDFLRDLAAFDLKNYSIKISQESLANELDCSLKTINRHIAEIKTAGFLTVKHNIKHDNANEPSTYYINFPEPVFALTELENNRVSTIHENSHVIAKEEKAEITTISCIKENTVVINDKISKNNSVRSSSTTALKPQDNNVHYPPVKNDALINNKKTNNNNIVVDISLSEKDNQQLEQTVSEIKHKLSDCKNKKEAIHNQLMKSKPSFSLDTHLKTLKDVINKPKDQLYIIDNERQMLNKQLQNMSELEQQLEHQLKSIEAELESHKKVESIKQNPNFINHVQGDRQFTSQELNSMLGKLQSYGLTGKRLNSLANEIVFESRFGSLTRSTCNKEFNTIKKCINIGCKLVREGQWSTPKGLFQLQATLN